MASQKRGAGFTQSLNLYLLPYTPAIFIKVLLKRRFHQHDRKADRHKLKAYNIHGSSLIVSVFQ